MQYEGIQLDDTIQITKLYTIHYFEYMSDFTFHGESHDFWEFACVDKGEISILSEDELHLLTKDEIIFHEPNEFHNVKGTGNCASNLIVISFECTSPIMDFFRKKRLKIKNAERKILAELLKEAKDCFSCRLDNPFQTTMPLNTQSTIGTQQIIRMKLELFLLSLYRRYRLNLEEHDSNGQNILHSTINDDTFESIHQYLSSNLHVPLSVPVICKVNLISKAKLHRIFKAKTGLGVMDYFSTLKIEEAKNMIRSKNYTITEISEHLGYTTVHYFSKKFRLITGMSPTQYATSIKAISEC